MTRVRAFVGLAAVLAGIPARAAAEHVEVGGRWSFELPSGHRFVPGSGWSDFELVGYVGRPPARSSWGCGY